MHISESNLNSKDWWALAEKLENLYFHSQRHDNIQVEINRLYYSNSNANWWEQIKMFFNFNGRLEEVDKIKRLHYTCCQTDIDD